MAETGHIKYIENFEVIISACNGFGSAYNPNNSALVISALQTALNAGNAGIDGVTTGLIPWKVKVNVRENEYAGVGKLSTKMAASFASCGATKNAVDDMKTFARKITGARKKKIAVDDPNTPDDESKHNSVSQRSYTQIAEHFDNMIKMCQNEPLYKPNEVEIQVGTAQTKLAAMRAANTGVIDAVTPLNKARITRDTALYDDSTGICELARLVKLYVKSVFGASSPQYKQISGLRFTKPR